MKRLLLCLLLSAALPAAAELRPPARLVSLNLCTDQLLLALAPREQILMLSQLAGDPLLSFAAAEAAGIRRFDGSVEAVIRLQPQLVLAGEYAAQGTVRMLRRLGYRVETFAMPESIQGVRQFIAAVAAALTTDASALIEAMDRQLRSAQRPLEPGGPRALLYLPNALSPGRGTLKDELLRHAGIHNLAAELGIHGYGSISLETLVREQPDLVLFDAAELQAPSLARSLLDHRALKRLAPAEQSIATSTWICPGPMIGAAAEALARSHDERLASR